MVEGPTQARNLRNARRPANLHEGPDYTDLVADVLDLFHEPVRTWFRTSFRAPTRPQRLGWPVIVRGESTLILAPTGTGKTLAAFLWAVDGLLRQGAGLADGTQVLYVSPLKALGVDV